MTAIDAPLTATDSPRLQALEALRVHLAGTDWSGQSPSRRRILEAFLELATSAGVTSVSMRMIANAVNIKASSIYAHFPDGRDEVVAESLRWNFHLFGVALVDAVEHTDTVDSYWNAMVSLHFQRQVQLPESNLSDLLVATDRMVHVLPTSLSAQIDQWNGLYEAMYVAAAREMGFMVSEERIRMILTLIEGATRWYTGSRSDGSVRQAGFRAVAMTLEMLRAGA